MSNPVNVKGDAAQLWQDVTLLRAQGLGVKLPDHAVSLAVATVQRSALDSQFKDVLVVSDGKHGEAKQAEQMQHYRLNALQLRKAASIVSGNVADLTDQEKCAVAAIDRLIEGGVAFQVAGYVNKSTYFGGIKEVQVSFPIDTTSPIARALIFTQSSLIDRRRTVSCILNGKPYPLTSHKLLTDAADLKTITASSLTRAVKVLKQHGIEAALADNEDVLAADLKRMKQNAGVNVRFSNTRVNSTMDDKPTPINDSNIHVMQTLSLSPAQIEGIAAAVAGDDAHLSFDSRNGLNAIDLLRKNGATFVLTRYRGEKTGTFPLNVFSRASRVCRDSLAVANDKSGHALILAYLAARPAGRQLSVMVDGSSYDIRTLDDLVAASRTTCPAIKLRDQLATLRAHGIEPQIEDHAVAMSVAAKSLETGQAIAVRFTTAAVTSNLQNMAATPQALSADEVAGSQTVWITKAQLNKVVNILNEAEFGLTNEEKAGLKAVETLTRNGASFQIQRNRYVQRKGGDYSYFTDTVTVPRDRVGHALLTVKPGAVRVNGNNWTSCTSYLVAGDQRTQFKNFQELVDIAQYLAE